MALRNEIRSIEDELNRLIIRMQDLRLKVDALEMQNARLLERLDVEEIKGEGVEELAKLYEEGYHICPTYFAQTRNGEECLFCQGLLNEQN